MKKYIEAISRMNSVTLSSSDDEIDRFSESDIFWAQHKNGVSAYKSKIGKGDILQFEFGKNYIPEMSYEHRGIVIGSSRKLLYVLPIYSYKPSATGEKPLHVTDNPNGKSDFYLLKQTEFPFLKHDSVVKLNDIRTVSDSRIKYPHNVNIPTNSDTYLFIEKNVFRRYFPSLSFEFDKTNKQLQEARDQVLELQKQIKELTGQ